MDIERPQLVIKPYTPWRIRIMLALSMVGLVVGGWMLFDFGRSSGGYDSLRVGSELQQLRDEAVQLRQEVKTLRQKAAKLEIALKVDKQANDKVKDSLAAMQQDNLELREELQFYRSIVSPTQARPGVHIHNFKIAPGEDERRYRYNLTLIHIQGPQEHGRQASGIVHLTIVGRKNGAPATLALRQITAPKHKNIRFSFRYFKRYEGNLILPEGFEPRSIVVKAVPGISNISGDQKKIKWPVVG